MTLFVTRKRIDQYEQDMRDDGSRRLLLANMRSCVYREEFLTKKNKNTSELR